MQRFTFSAVAILTVLLCQFADGADVPSTQPTTAPADTSTPTAFLITYDHLAGQGPEAYRTMYSLDDSDDSQRLAQVQGKFDAEAGMMQKMVAQLWGDGAVDDTLHALGLKTLRDIQSATIKEVGATATVTFADGTVGPELIRTASGWKLDLQALRRSLGVPIDDYLKQIRVLSKIIPDVADQIAAGKLKESSDVVSEITREINPN